MSLTFRNCHSIFCISCRILNMTWYCLFLFKIPLPKTHGESSLDPSPFFHLSKVPSVSVSEISHIPISRCSTVSRLDRIRTLWRSMLPLGDWKRQRCVASSSAGRRATPGPCPAWSVDEASLPSVARRFMTLALGEEEKGNRKNLNYKELYNLTPKCSW